MKRILVVFGTRPEAIKMSPLVKELKTKRNIETLVCVTAQHRKMLDQVLQTFHITVDFDLNMMKDHQTLFDITSLILSRMRDVLEKVRPDMVLVHGDTTTAFAVSLACFYLHIPVSHIEAGLRTFQMDAPYPEEFNRQVVDMISDYYFAPTELARNNLLREGKCAERIFVTGNTVVDAIKESVSDDFCHAELDWVGDNRLILVTAHRRENIGKPMRNMFRAICRIVQEYADVRVIYPMHPNPCVRKIASEILQDNKNVHLIEPLEVTSFHNFMNASYVVLTDSGGIQEEAVFLGKPTLVMRKVTERVEGLSSGIVSLLGTEENAIYDGVKKMLDNPLPCGNIKEFSSLYGDGNSSKKIADILERILV